MVWQAWVTHTINKVRSLARLWIKQQKWAFSGSQMQHGAILVLDRVVVRGDGGNVPVLSVQREGMATDCRAESVPFGR